MWSSRFYRGFCERAECRKSQCLQGLSAFFVFSESVGGVLLPKQARYQLRHTSIKFFIVKRRNCPLVRLNPRALPVATKALFRVAQNSQVAATPYASLHPPPAALRQRPQLRHTSIALCVEFKCGAVLPAGLPAATPRHGLHYIKTHLLCQAVK